jgi:ElaB/YqjD/DUF883 family membrane-anchored ribosome-binding protein
MNNEFTSTTGTTGSQTNGKASIKDSVQSLVDQGSQTVGVIKTRVGDMTQQAKAQGSVMYMKTSKLIYQNPLKSVAIAFGVGYLAMRLRSSRLIKMGLIAGLGYVGKQISRS